MVKKKKERSKEKDSCVEYLVFIYVIIIYIYNLYFGGNPMRFMIYAGVSICIGCIYLLTHLGIPIYILCRFHSDQI